MFCGDQDARALVRLQCDHVNRNLVPAFYRYLQAQTDDAVLTGAEDFVGSLKGLASLLERAERESGATACGLWNNGTSLSLTDVMAGPCMLLVDSVCLFFELGRLIHS
jgi:glutathione S-transferase